MKSNKGFTLVEVVVAVLILSLMGAATLRLFSAVVKNDNDIKRHIKANYISQKVMESEKSKRYEQIDFSEDGDQKSAAKYFDEDGDDITSQVSQISTTKGFVAEVTYSNPQESIALENLMQIDVRVYFNGEKNVQISSLARKLKEQASED